MGVEKQDNTSISKEEEKLDSGEDLLFTILNHITMDDWKTMGENILQDKVYFLVNLKSCHARVLNWAIRDNIQCRN